ncbi:M20/M25/M40 family metallo-hydrolase [Microbacterium sp. CFH 31415]|uniref:M20/M25/M40 family metallo-hydrolase n=1 Tax=Microbacterium sp. CFH 31415 TaxID=2921732 RepID=UPI001F13A3F4|nr:M20/M25/M40 family metallo-hydrolase [Microbacterium sp. CFH 31415]MCH6230153.1 M20/M25/M40 family metallo-hydrolase [Microbacterium sp. CFH 31415]
MPSPTDLGGAAVDLTAALVAIDSVSPSLVPSAEGEARIASVLAERLGAAGYAVELIAAPSDPRRVSVLALRTGSRPGRTVVLNGHLDTVGVEGMPQPFAPRIADGRLTGRGASDMKGGVAGLVVAAERLAELDAPGMVIVALVADEEDASVGAEAVLQYLAARDVHMDVCLIGEPTWLDIAAAHRGYAVVEVAFHGKAAHSSQPDEGVDAARATGELLASIAATDADLRRRPRHPLLPSGSLMATVVRAGSAPFAVAAAGEVTVERRTLPGEAAADALDEVRDLVDAVTARTPGLTAEVRLTHAREAWEADAAGSAAEFTTLLGEALTDAGSRHPESIGAPYWMESALWQAAGVPTVVCGPAGGGLHAIDEWVEIAQVERYAVAVTEAVGRFLEVPA